MSFISNQPIDRVTSFVRSLVELYRDRDISFMAGSIAYSAFVSLIPLVVLLLTAATLVGGESLRDYVLDATDQYLTPTASDMITEALSQPDQQVGVSILGLVTLVWASLRVFRSLDKAFSEIYWAGANASLLGQVRDGLIVLGAVAVAVLVTFVAGAAIAIAPALQVGEWTAFPVVRVVSFLVLVVGLTLAFLPPYYVFPDVSVDVREVLPGAVFAAVGWTLLQALFQVYVSMSSATQLYGVIGGVILFVTWLHFGAVVVLLGAGTNVILSGRKRAQSLASSGDASRSSAE